MGLFSRLKGKIKRGIVMRATLWLTKGLANGRFGSKAQKAWLFLEGFKTYTGVALMIAGDAMQTAYSAGVCPNCPEWGAVVVGVGAFLTYIGMSDSANREPSAEQEEEWKRGYNVRPIPPYYRPTVPQDPRAQEVIPRGGVVPRDK